MPGEPRYSNCLFFALGRWWRRGGYLVIRKSRWGWWPHFIHCSDLRDARIEHNTPASGRWRWWIPPLVFRGRVRTEDRPSA